MERTLLPSDRQNEKACNGGKPLQADARYARRREQEFQDGRDKRGRRGKMPGGD